MRSKLLVQGKPIIRGIFMQIMLVMMVSNLLSCLYGTCNLGKERYIWNHLAF